MILSPLLEFKLKYNERVVDVLECVHSGSPISRRIMDMGIPLHEAVFKINMHMPLGESLFFDDDGYLIHKYSKIETYDNSEALDKAKKYFKL